MEVQYVSAFVRFSRLRHLRRRPLAWYRRTTLKSSRAQDFTRKNIELLQWKQADYEALPSHVQSGVLREKFGVLSSEDIVGHLSVQEYCGDEHRQDGVVSGDSPGVPAM